MKFIKPTLIIFSKKPWIGGEVRIVRLRVLTVQHMPPIQSMRITLHKMIELRHCDPSDAISVIWGMEEMFVVL